MFLTAAFAVLAGVCCVEATVLINNPNYCYSADPIHPQIALLFSGPTPYDSVRGQWINPIVSQCKASRIWYLGRHGAR